MCALTMNIELLSFGLLNMIMEKEASTYDVEMLESIIRFLDEIGIQVVEQELEGECFLPGLEIQKETIVYDKNRLKFPGDILHEAGHIAVTPKEERSLIGTEKMDPAWPSDGDEIASVLWSYAALRQMEIEPEVVFHPEGYKNQSDWIIEQFESGNFIGLPLLDWMGLSDGVNDKAFPKIVKWLR